MGKRAIIYIDGFNFYYGMLRSAHSRRCKWLDYQKLFTMIRQDDEIQKIRYFTAFWPDASGDRHKVYAKALSTLPLMETVLGHYKKKTAKCRVAACAHAGDRKYDSSEEKQSDVNIALWMLDDAYQGLCDIMVLVSADSDLVPAVSLVKTRFPEIKVVVYIPGPHQRFLTAVELRATADDAKLVPANLLAKCLLPDRVQLAGGQFADKPASW